MLREELAQKEEEIEQKRKESMQCKWVIKSRDPETNGKR